MALAGARWAEEVYDLATIDELQLGERHDAVFVERGLEREVEASERLNCGEACHHQRDLDAAVLTQRELLSPANRSRRLIKCAKIATLPPSRTLSVRMA